MSSHDPDAPAKLPETLGRYVLDRVIAEGGMARVYRARRRGPGGFEKPVALKCMFPELAAESDFVKMFAREARMMAGLVHPNLVQIYDYDEAGGVHHIAMELVEGVDLRRLRDRAGSAGLPFPVPLATYVMGEVLRGLGYAHRFAHEGKPLQLVHRDISPHNVLCAGDGAVKLADFGVAKAALGATVTQAGVIKGKIGYMSPEQVRGRPLDGRSDLYSLGVVFCELLVARKFRPSEEWLAGKTPVVPELARLNPEVDEGLERLVRRLLSESPGDRPGSAEEALAELDRAGYYRPRAAELAAFMRQVEGGDSLEIEIGPAGGAQAGKGGGTVNLGLSPPAAIPEPESVPAPPDASTGVGGLLRAIAGLTASAGQPLRPPTAPTAPAALLHDSVNALADTAQVDTGPTTLGDPTALTEVRPVPLEPVTPRPSVSASGPSGQLMVTVSPWALVSVDGVPVGETPLGLRLAAGDHRIVLENPPLGRREELAVTITASQTTSLHRQWG